MPARTLTLLVLLACLLPDRAPAQTASPSAGATMVRAAGTPLQVSDLPAGTLTVRIVEGAFTDDLEGVPVHLDVHGNTGREAPTGTEGRATFADLQAGFQVRAWAQVAGERLESDWFEMPSTGGVRLLLVAGANAGTAPAAAGLASVATTAAPATSRGVAGVLRPAPGADAAFLAMLGLPLSALGFLVFRVVRRDRRSRTARA